MRTIAAVGRPTTAIQELTLAEVKHLTNKKNRLRPSAQRALTAFYALSAEQQATAKFMVMATPMGRICALQN